MYTILMVDDEENIRKALVNAIDWESIGFRIIGEASNGVEALDFIENNEVDLLVTDIKMPIMGGIELARAARDVRPSMQMVFLSGYDHFQFAKLAIRYNILEYILKPITAEQILEEFTRIKIKLDEKFSEILNIDTQIDALKELQELKKDILLSKLITNGITEGQMKDDFNQVNMNIPDSLEENNYYAVCVVKVKGIVPHNQEVIIYKRLLNIVKIISQKYISCECLLYGDRVVVVSGDRESVLEKYLGILSKDIVLSAKRIMNQDVSIAQSNYYTDVLQTYIAYDETNDALMCIEKTEEQMVHIKDLAIKADDLEIQELLYELEAQIIGGDKDKVSVIMRGIFQHLEENSINTAEFNLYVLEILSVLFKARRMLNDEGEMRTIIAKFISFHSTKQKIEEEMLDLCLNVTDGISNQRQKTVGILVAEARKIIFNEFDNSEMSLNLLAERLHCSANYLSSIIKKTLGKSFVELLVEARMKRAKELLLTTNKKMREISEECGFANQHYFSYSFKKYFDQSPNTMRKLMMIEKE